MVLSLFPSGKLGILQTLVAEAVVTIACPAPDLPAV
jgi:hypothetical protein